jgi:hypothetical protein
VSAFLFPGACVFVRLFVHLFVSLFAQLQPNSAITQDLPDEAERIRKAGGFVIHNRVMGTQHVYSIYAV